jgi:hypothetical protein
MAANCEESQSSHTIEGQSDEQKILENDKKSLFFSF